MKFQPLLILFLSLTAANAQKLPNVQTVAVRAPQSVKIDGKLTEWDDTFHAHNSATDILYTIANDDENLYLVVRAEDNNTINRIVGKGLTLNIQKSGRKNTKDRISFTYPVTEKGSALIFTFTPKRNGVLDTAAAAVAARVLTANRNLGQKAKNIQVLGVEGIDSLISVYNDNGIKVKSLIDDKTAYNMEFAIPLKYLKLSAADGGKFTYQIVANGMMNMMGIISFTPAPGATPEQAARLEASMQKMNDSMAQRSAPTDFWGEYTLAKK
jgi:hypothetical protein